MTFVEVMRIGREAKKKETNKMSTTIFTAVNKSMTVRDTKHLLRTIKIQTFR